MNKCNLVQACWQTCIHMQIYTTVTKWEQKKKQTNLCWRQSRQKNGKARKRDMRHKRNARKAAKTMGLFTNTCMETFLPCAKNKCIQSLLHLGNVRTGLSLTTERKFENLNHSEQTGLRELHTVPISLLVKHKKPAPMRQGSRRNSKSEETETILSDKSVWCF